MHFDDIIKIIYRQWQNQIIKKIMCKRNEWKVQGNHLDSSTDDTSSLPPTNIINLSYDRSKFFLVFFLYKKNRSTCKKVVLRNSTKNQTKAIKNNSILWPSIITHSGNMIDL